MRRLVIAGLCARRDGGRRVEAYAACCYFTALGKDVNQPAQKAFITWDPPEKIESFTVQPKFEGNAADFGMVIPTPVAAEARRDAARLLQGAGGLHHPGADAARQVQAVSAAGAAGGRGCGGAARCRRAESTRPGAGGGVVGSLDYKIITAERADDLYQWLKENSY